MGYCDRIWPWVSAWWTGSGFCIRGVLSRDQTREGQQTVMGMSVAQLPSGSGSTVGGREDAFWWRQSKAPTTESIIDTSIVLLFFSLLLSPCRLCLCVPPASSHSLIVASHAVNAVACLREDELIYLSGTGTAGKTCSMIRRVLCEERLKYVRSGSAWKRLVQEYILAIMASSRMGSLHTVQL